MSDRLLGTPRTGGLIDVVSASVGAGHLAAARAIAAQFVEQGYPTRRWDILDLMPGSLGQLIRTTYVRQVQIAPSTYRWMLRSQAGTLDWLMHQAVRPVYRRVLQMSLEALAAGVPVVTYRCIAGHGETNASVLDRAGLVPWIRSYAHLGDGISKAIAPTGRPDPWSTTLAIRPSIVQAVLSPPLRQSA